ncbi:hypothetical protein ABLT40_09840 [Acinetobacter schindleri]|uniref:hypothetical protein n=1 Tax=Acinetobacter schindleri TaxID=108981 RepID=UPI0032B4B945
MSVPEQTPYKEYTGNGVTKNFALEFTCDLKQELKVFIDNVEPESSTWSLVGGSVVFTTAPSSGLKIVLKRATKLERTTNYSSTNNSFRPESINNDLDRVWYALQDQAYKLGQYDLDYTYAINTSNLAKQIAQNANQKADSAYELADQTQPINKGGTGATTAENARTSLDVYSQAEVDALIATGGQGNFVPIAGGGTGATTAEDARTNLEVYSKDEVYAKADALAKADLVNNLTSTDATKALTAAQGKVLADRDFGIGQTYQLLTSSRLLNTAYINTTGRPIFVIVVIQFSGAGSAYLTIGGYRTASASSVTGAGQHTTLFFPVPPSESYYIDAPNGTILTWRELRT